MPGKAEFLLAAEGGGSTLKKYLSLVLLVLCLLLAGCTGEPEPEPTPTPTPSAAPSEAAEFALACYPEGGFHPITGGNRTNLSLGRLIYEGLYVLDQQFQPQEQLCAGSVQSADGLSWTFTLRAGVTFSDGSPLTTGEVKASLDLARTSTLYAARLSDITQVTAEEGTVTVSLSRPNGGLPALLDIPIVKETGSVPLGTGPYVLSQSEESWSLTARQDWWQNQPLPLEEIPLRTIRETDDLIHAFDTRDIALVATDLTGTNALGFSGSFDTVDYPTSVMLYVGFNVTSGPCRTALVRQALLRAFDRAAVSTAIYASHALPAALPLSPASPYYQEELAQELEYAPQQAAELLAQAGWIRGDGGWTSGRQRLSLSLVAPSDNAIRATAAEHLANGLKELDIQVELRLLAWDDYLAALDAGDFDLYLGEVRLTADFDLTALITPGGSLNFGGYADEQAAQLLQAYRAASGQGRDLSARRLSQRLMEEPPFGVLCFKNWSVLTQWSRISNLTPTQQNVFYGFAQWRIA